MSEAVEALPAGAVAAGGGVRLRRAVAGTLRDYVTLTKPRIMSLLVLIAVCSMVAGAGGTPAPLHLLALAIGGALACGGASALNHVLDRDIDRLMGPRTQSRPIAAGRISPAAGAWFGVTLSALAFALLDVTLNLPAATLAISGGLYYVVVYTAWLKRQTDQNIVIGGAAGAIPTLAGWAAAQGRLGAGAWILFLIVLLWTPPHFWALALLMAPQYEAARIPMLPVVRGSRTTARQVLAYSIALTVFTLVPAVFGVFGVFYLLAAVPLGATLCGLSWRLHQVLSARRAALLFHFSLLYLALLFVAVAVDAAIK